MRSTFAAAAAFASLATAQTFTSCNPLQKTCPSDPALGTSITVDFTKGASSAFAPVPGTTLTYGSNGAEFTINKDGQAPTVESAWYIMFGTVEVVMQAAPGVGIVSSVVLESDDLDEVDWEWLGGDAAQVQTNYFGKGDTTTYDRGGFSAVANPQSTFHTYKLDWSASSIKWSIDGNVVRTLNYADAKGGSRFPQTPCRVKLGNWVGGSPNAASGTQQWAGGLTDFSKAPFTMLVKSIKVTDGTTGAKEYVYGDNSGSWQSIKAQGSNGGNPPTVSDSTSLVVISSTNPPASSPTVASPSSSVAVAASSTAGAGSGSAAATTTLIRSTTTANTAIIVSSPTPSVTGNSTIQPVSATAPASSTHTGAANRAAATNVALAGMGIMLGMLAV